MQNQTPSHRIYTRTCSTNVHLFRFNVFHKACEPKHFRWCPAQARFGWRKRVFVPCIFTFPPSPTKRAQFIMLIISLALLGAVLTVFAVGFGVTKHLHTNKQSTAGASSVSLCFIVYRNGGAHKQIRWMSPHTRRTNNARIERVSWFNGN